MQPSTVVKESSGRSGRSGEEVVSSGRSGCSVEGGDGWTDVKRKSVRRSLFESESALREEEFPSLGLEKKTEKMGWKELKKRREEEKKEKKLREEKKRERKLEKQMEEMEMKDEKERKEVERKKEERKVWKTSVPAEEDGWTAVKGRSKRRSEESSGLSEEEYPSFEKEKTEKEKKEKVLKKLFEERRREKWAKEEKKRERKMEKQLEEEKKELERQRVLKKQGKVQLRREKEDSGSERRIAAGFKRGRKQSSEEREVEQIMSDNLLEPEKEKRPQRKSKKVDTCTDVSTYLFTIFLSHNTGLSHISKS